VVLIQTGRADDSISLIDRHMRSVEAITERAPSVALDVLMVKHTALVSNGRLRESLALVEPLYESAVSSGDDDTRASTAMGLSGAFLDLGRPRRAVGLLRESLARGRKD